jgi:misacylated tRNA(Ala) deacylase
MIGKPAEPRPFYHEHPETLTLESEVVDSRAGQAVLARSPFFPGGGGQLPDRGVIRWSGGEVAVRGFETVGDQVWHLLADDVEIGGFVEAAVDPAFRQLMRELHTDTHILNAFVFTTFSGALVTGAQMNPDGVARMDFDLPDADNDRLRALEAPINDVISEDLPVEASYVRFDEAKHQTGLIRNRSVAPPPTRDGRIRIVEIVGLDRQACGGTHLASTGTSRSIEIVKVDNKGRHNRRIYISLRGITRATDKQ